MPVRLRTEGRGLGEAVAVRGGDQLRVPSGACARPDGEAVRAADRAGTIGGAGKGRKRAVAVPVRLRAGGRRSGQHADGRADAELRMLPAGDAREGAAVCGGDLSGDHRVGEDPEEQHQRVPGRQLEPGRVDCVHQLRGEALSSGTLPAVSGCGAGASKRGSAAPEARQRARRRGEGEFRRRNAGI